MDCYDYAIVGSGPAGIAAGLRLQGRNACLIDAGQSPPQRDFPFASLRDALAAGDATAVLGRQWEMLIDLVESNRTHPKLRAAALRFVMGGEPFTVRDADGAALSRGAASYAAGGMSNVWGGQLLRYTDADLTEAGDWPIDAAALAPYYDALEDHIGLSGKIDDMAEFLGGAKPAMPPIPIAPAAAYLYDRYLARRTEANKKRLLLGRPRLSVATEPFRGEPAHEFGETEFFTCRQAGLYTARKTLDELKAGGGLTHFDHHRLLSWHETPDAVELVLETGDGTRRTVRTRHLLLGCGAVHTARLVLRHHGEPGRTVPFIEHPPILLPLFLPAMFGRALPQRSFPIQLIGTLPDRGRGTMISFYYPGGMLWSDLLQDIPLPMKAARKVMPALLGGMLVAQIWQTSRPSPRNRLGLDDGGRITVTYADLPPSDIVPPLLAALRPLRAYSLPRFASLAPPGWGFHYAGCLPMRHSPGPYETHADGRLWDSRRVRVIDGSALPSLPAKNHSLTLMANAARIADEVARCGF